MKAFIVDPGETWNNYHTHTYRCDHASGDVEDYVMRASSLGMSKIGISEHAWIPGNGNQVFRMREEAVPDYVLSCRTADASHEDVKVLCGVECDYDPSDERRIREYYLDELGLDYLVGSVHELKNGKDVMDCFANRHFGVRQLRIYTDLYVRMIGSGLFTFCAHPDLFGRPVELGEDAPGWDLNAQAAAREILEAAREHHAVLEMNVSGVWKTHNKGYGLVIYPRWQFWEMASDYDIRVILNTDAHSPERLDAFTDYGLDLIRRYGLKRVELERD